MRNEIRRLLFWMFCLVAISYGLIGEGTHAKFEHLPHENCWIVDHTAVTLTKELGRFRGNNITVPVFSGQGPVITEDLLYKELKAQGKEPYLAQSFCFLAARGKVRHTVRDILKFYAKNVLKEANLSKPTYLAECELNHEKACKKKLSMDDGTATWKNLKFNGIPDNIFQIFFPAKPGVTVMIRKFEDIPIAEEGGWQNPEADERSKKFALIKWTVR